MKSFVLAFSHIWPCRKIGKGQPRVIIYTILAILAYIMLHTKFQGYQSISIEKKIFVMFLPYMGMVAILDM